MHEGRHIKKDTLDRMGLPKDNLQPAAIGVGGEISFGLGESTGGR